MYIDVAHAWQTALSEFLLWGAVFHLPRQIRLLYSLVGS